MIEPILLTAARVCTFNGNSLLTNASGFFYEHDKRLFFVTSRHVMIDEPNNHHPDRIEIELHVDARDMVKSTRLSIPLYRGDKRLWRQGIDSAGEVDVAAIEIERSAMPANAAYRAFGPQHLMAGWREAEVGASLLVVGFPLGFHDTLHHLPVARQAILASSFGLRFEGQGYFLTDARTHRGISGAPVVMRAAEPIQGQGDLPWMLLGVHSARLDVGTRDLQADEALGLNCAWYADIVMTLTDNPPVPAVRESDAA